MSNLWGVSYVIDYTYEIPEYEDVYFNTKKEAEDFAQELTNLLFENYNARLKAIYDSWMAKYKKDTLIWEAIEKAGLANNDKPLKPVKRQYTVKEYGIYHEIPKVFKYTRPKVTQEIPEDVFARIKEHY